MIPVGDNLPNPGKPISNHLLIGINLALFFWELRLEVNSQLGELINSWGIVPARISTVTTDTLTAGNPATWIAWMLVTATLIQSIFLHHSYSQILGNLLFLWVFGKQVEAVLGHGRFLLFYLLCGVLTGIIQVLVEPTLSTPLIGSNGAIAGILGAYFISFPRAKIDTLLPVFVVLIPVELPALFYLFWWFVQQLFYNFGSLNIPGVNFNSIGYWSHGFGLAIGAGLVKLLQRRQ